MTSPREQTSRRILEAACTTAELDCHRATVIRLAENDLWRLPNAVVARIARPGQHQAAAREVAVTRWLATHHVPAVRPLPIDQPVHAEGRAVTFWEELPPHRHGTPAEMAPLLQRLHTLPMPGIDLGQLDPFVRVVQRLTAARSVKTGDRDWLLHHLADLQTAWVELPDGLPRCVIHADAWTGNVAVTSTTAYLMDFERTSFGPPEWDLTSTAITSDTFGTLASHRYQEFCTAYGHDVITWQGYPVLRAIRELRLVTFALQTADDDPTATSQAQYRIDCVRGRNGPRPWHWTAVGG
ncbi:aminoglycoside phosphotransferase family protein [Streptomyces sp. HU2014]|uniref:phosphotransferase enzyme family protein n=1 Tax=Streptomyces sp. HU2014 TaxID=2939414 RepID=UPI00200CE32F|nr:aminoglycoside phosphotransferase family protein [Streptomyces sp. HU2014]UQI45909.1 aminoglycoside phosphotransferase family protein [Streptomyces sp. HU2014]